MKTCTPRFTAVSVVNQFPSAKNLLLPFLLLLVGWSTTSAQTPCTPVLVCNPSSRVVSCADSAANPWGDPGYTPEFMQACGFTSADITVVPWPSKVTDCDSIYASVIIRMWGLPGYPTLCTDTTYVARVNILSDSLVCPDGRDTVICGIDPDPLTDLSVRAPMYQIPGVDTFPLYDTSAICGVYVNVTDMGWPSCGNTKTVMRTWFLHDECGNDTVCYDTIVYIDELPPTVSFDTANLAIELHDLGFGEREYLTDTIGMAPSGCVGHGLAPYATVSDNCTDPSEIDISIIGTNSLALLHYTADQQISLPLWNIPGEREILIYTSTDDCGNSRMDTVVLIISDQTPATAICHDRVNLSLTNVDQFSFMKAASMDAESHDNCAIYQILARRTDWMTACGYEAGVQTAIGDYYDHYAEWVAVDPGICQDIYEYGFAPDVPFCCEDVGKDIMVEIMVIDFNCNVDRCWGFVRVEDKLPPIVVSELPDISITCNAYVTYYQDMFEDMNTSLIQENFGKYVVDINERESFMVNDLPCADPNNPVASNYVDGLLSDNCGGLFSERYTLPQEGCGSGYILREFIAAVSTDNGMQDVVYATQKIHIEKCPLDLMNITLSMHDTVVYDCGFTFGLDGNVTIPTSGPQLPNIVQGCGQYGVGYFDKIFEVVNGTGCFKIMRTWCVVDWCEVSGAGDWSALVKEPGTISFNQFIKIIDTVPPDIQEITMVTDIQTQSCNGTLTAQIDATDNCGEPSVSWDLKTLSGQFVASGIGEIAEPNDLLPPDSYRLRWTAEDPCGNVSELVSDFTISSDAKPSLVAKTALSAVLTPMDTNNDGIVDVGMAQVWASEFNSSSAPACGGDPEDLTFLIARGFADANSPVPSDDATALQFTCADFNTDPTMIPIQFWAKDGSTGGADYLNVMLLLYDNSNICGGGQQGSQNVSIISGQISTENQEQIPDVKVRVTNNIDEAEVITGDAGLYQAGIPLEDHTMIIPEKDTEHAKGLSTADLIKVQKHILGIRHLDSPYKLIAADANRDGIINPLDLIQLRKVLIGQIDKFPNNTSWRFVDASYHFKKEDHAQEETFPEYIELNSVTGRDATKNFVGIKIGDLNGNVFTSTTSSRSREKISLVVPKLQAAIGEILELPVYLEQLQYIEGIQLELKTDANHLQILDVSNGQLELEESAWKVGDNREFLRLSLPMAEGADLEPDRPLFYVKLLAVQAADLMQSMALSNNRISSEVYVNDGVAKDLNLKYIEQPVTNSTKVFLMQNQPNPFRQQTTIEFILDEAQYVGLRIFDPAGRVLHNIYQHFDQGSQRLVFDRSQLVTGVLYYELKTKYGSETKRMILLD